MKKLFIVSMIASFALNCQSMSMQEVFDAAGANGNVSGPSALQGQTMNMVSSGSMFLRTPNKTYNLAMVTPPSWNAGCGGIDLYMGGFSFINKDQFVAMMKNIGSNALGYGFKLAMQNLCPTCDNVMQALQATANQINRLNMDSCQAAKGIVQASMPASWQTGKQDAAKNYGVDGNIFENITDAWVNVMNNEKKANDTVNAAGNNKPDAEKSLPKGNIVWKALKKIDGIDDEYRMILMSMIGTVIMPTEGPRTNMRIIPREDIQLHTLIGNDKTVSDLKLTVLRCDTLDENGCLYPVRGESAKETKTFRYMVREKLFAVASRIGSRQPHPDVSNLVAFLNTTDLPVYKMISVGASRNSTAISDSLIDRYQDLIAAKYAEAYIKKASFDLMTALTEYQAQTFDAGMAAQVKDLTKQATEMEAQTRSMLQNAYTQTMTSFNVAQEVQHIERAMAANMSSTLRNSLAFGKSIR